MTDVTHYRATETIETPSGERRTSVATGQPSSKSKVKFDTAYLKTPNGGLKLIEILFSLIVFICATSAVRYRDVFYGCAVWASVVGFFSMLFTLILLVVQSLRVGNENSTTPAAGGVPWRTINTAYSALWAVFFLIACVTLAVVAESAITRQRVSYYRVGYIGDGQVITDTGTALPPVPDNVDGKRAWMIQRTEGNFDEYRPATAGAVFAIATCLVYAADAYLSTSQKSQDGYVHGRSKNGVAV